MAYLYSIYGLTIEADRAINGMRALSAPMPVDVRVWVDARPVEMRLDAHAWHPHPDYASRRPHDQGDDPQIRILQSADGRWIQLHYKSGLQVVLDAAGTLISITGTDDLMRGPFEAFLVGPVLGFVMRLRGILALHASGIEVAQRGMVFCAMSGSGKSTLASTLLKDGRLITDDTAALTLEGETWFVHPGGQRLRLWADSSDGLQLPDDQLVPILPGYSKRYMDSKSLIDQRVGLGAIYLLRRGEVEAAEIAPMAASAALIALVSCTYANYLIDRQMRAYEFQMLQKLVTRVPAFTLIIPNDLARLDAVRDAVVSHFMTV